MAGGLHVTTVHAALKVVVILMFSVEIGSVFSLSSQMRISKGIPLRSFACVSLSIPFLVVISMASVRHFKVIQSPCTHAKVILCECRAGSPTHVASRNKDSS